MDRPQSLFGQIKEPMRQIRMNKDSYGVTDSIPPEVAKRLPNVWPVPIDTIVTRDLWIRVYFKRRGGNPRSNDISA